MTAELFKKGLDELTDEDYLKVINLPNPENNR